MAGFIVLGALAAFGLMCAVWVLCGLAARGQGSGILIYSGRAPVAAARCYLWLRELELVRCPVVVLDPDEESRTWLEARGIEICSRETLLSRLETGAESN